MCPVRLSEYIAVISVYSFNRGSGIAQSGWTVRGSNPGVREIFRTCPDRPGVHPASYAMGTGSLPGVKRPVRGVDQPPHLAPRLKKEWGYTSSPPLDLRGFI